MEGMQYMSIDEGTAINLERPAPLPFEQDVIFVSIDLEWWEHQPQPITEIGISILDTEDLAGVAPGADVGGWLGQIRSRHFRIIEQADKVNETWVQGCPDRFEKEFGTSEFIHARDAAAKVAECLRTPLKRPYRTGAKPTFGLSVKTIHRPIVVVGHDPGQDLAFLRKLGVRLEAFPHVLEVLDTVPLFRAFKLDVSPNAPSLAQVLVAVQLTGWNLHNAVS